jgi:hypothetical protein
VVVPLPHPKTRRHLVLGLCATVPQCWCGLRITTALLAGAKSGQTGRLLELNIVCGY